MCSRGMPYPEGIPIPAEVYVLYPANVKKAWKTFDKWWHQNFSGENQVSRSSMPDNIAAALKVISEAPIPGYANATGADSCYVIGVNNRLID